MAATTRTSVFCTLAEPTRRNSPDCSTRNRRTCVDKGSSPTSSRNIVPPSASSKYPLRASVAPVKAPFSCPKSSESIVPSGMAPQFTAIYLACLRAEYACIICGKNSFPTPLSPTTSTDRSVGATRRATLKARFSSSELPIIPKRCFTDVMSIFSAILRSLQLFVAAIRSAPRYTPDRDLSHPRSLHRSSRSPYERPAHRNSSRSRGPRWPMPPPQWR